LLQPLWQAAQAKSIEVASSELALMETLVGPLKSGDKPLQHDYEKALLGTDMRLVPITQSILRQAAKLRDDQAENTRRPPRRHSTRGSLCPLCH
jgi:predicted nucleic acid-binding protein